MLDLVKRYSQLKSRYQEVKEQLEAAESAIWIAANATCKSEKMKVENDFYKVKIDPVWIFHVDQELAAKCPVDVWKVKRELDKKKYDLLPSTQMSIVNQMITTKQGKPRFEILLKGGNNE